jgi:vacuolar-type H+-ATPase subunit F/Vma7
MNKFDKVFPVTEDYLEHAINFDSKYNDVIENIKDIYYTNLDNKEKEIFLEIINKNNEDEESNEENVITCNDISKDEILKEFIKEYISISMIKCSNDDNEYKIILFIPTENNNIKEQITKYIETTECKDLLTNILFGSLDYYNVEENYD